MKHLRPQTQKLQETLLSTPLTESKQRLLMRLEAGCGRVAAATGENAPMEVGPPVGNSVACPAIAHTQLSLSRSDVVALLHRGGECARRENLPAQSWNEDASPRGLAR